MPIFASIFLSVEFQTLSQHSDATRDIGVAAQRHGAMMRVGSWYGGSVVEEKIGGQAGSSWNACHQS